MSWGSVPGAPGRRDVGKVVVGPAPEGLVGVRVGIGRADQPDDWTGVTQHDRTGRQAGAAADRDLDEVAGGVGTEGSGQLAAGDRRPVNREQPVATGHPGAPRRPVAQHRREGDPRVGLGHHDAEVGGRVVLRLDVETHRAERSSGLGRARLPHPLVDQFGELVAVVQELLRAFPDLTLEVTDQAGTSERLATVWTMRGTDRGGLFDLGPPRGSR